MYAHFFLVLQIYIFLRYLQKNWRKKVLLLFFMKRIEINTTHNVVIEYPLATLGERFLARLIDVIVLGIFAWLLLYMLSDILRFRYSNLIFEFFQMFLMVFSTMLYPMFFEAFFRGQTLGKMALGIRVVELDGRAPTFGDLFLRSVLGLIDFWTSFGIFGAILIVTSDRRQRLGDMGANTAVIQDARKARRTFLIDVLKIQTLNNYTPVYPQVRQLTEDDMLTIRHAIVRYQQHTNEAHKIVLEDLVNHLKNILNIQDPVFDKVTFLKTLVQDYVVLTR
jgi:uncharacterized RDD family membrane protein YckC